MIFPEEIRIVVRSKRADLMTHDEAYYIIPHQVESIIHSSRMSMKVISGDTDAFVICMSFLPFCQRQLVR